MEQSIDYFSRILELCDGNQELVVELGHDLLFLFSPEALSQLESYILEGDGESLAKSAHRLRGGSS